MGVGSGAATLATAPPVRFADCGVKGLRGWVRVFAGYTSPRIVVPLLVASLGLRLALGGFRAADLLTAAVIVALQPFTEWLIHVFILHFRPRTWRGRRIDLYIAGKHRAHHADPQHIGLTLVQTPALVGLVIGYAVITAVIFREPRLALSADVAGYALLLLYEWTHFLIHTPYAPRTWVYRRIWRAHRLHHFKNEHYWFGITSHVADHVLRTYRARDAVPTSPTARSLHGEGALKG